MFALSVFIAIATIDALFLSGYCLNFIIMYCLSVFVILFVCLLVLFFNLSGLVCMDNVNGVEVAATAAAASC